MSELVRRDVLPKVDCLWQKVDSYLGLCGNLGMNASRIVLPQQVWLAGEIPVTRQWQKSDSQRCGHKAEETLGEWEPRFKCRV